LCNYHSFYLTKHNRDKKKTFYTSEFFLGLLFLSASLPSVGDLASFHRTSLQVTMNPQAKKRRLEDPADFLPASTSFEKMMDKTFFADKSSLIPFIEEDRNVIFCCPSRFGKSLILQMLMAYFDKKTDDAKFTAVCLCHCFSYCYNSSSSPLFSSSLAPCGLGGKMETRRAKPIFRASSSSSRWTFPRLSWTL